MAAYALFALNDATNKFLVTSLPVAQALFFRSMTISLGCLAVGRGQVVAAIVASPVRARMLVRAVITLVAWLCYFSAAPLLPFAQMMTLYFASPIITTLLATRLLDERVSPVRWASIFLGFAGVVVSADPRGLLAGETPAWAIGLVMAAAVLWAHAAIMMRQIARHEGALVQMLLQNGFFLVVTGAWTAFHWVAPSALQLMLLIAIGAIGAGGQLFQFAAIRRAPVAVMAVVEYSGLVWAFALGWLIFADDPPMAVYLGAAIILAAGMFLVAMEQRAGRRK
ncbi:MAG: DMT family transporter [Acetobacteraceae bacterium]|nr:DMT family transporter [Acetobacteraceae bacterium]